MAQITGAKHSVSGCCLPLTSDIPLYRIVYVTADKYFRPKQSTNCFSPSPPVVYDVLEWDCRQTSLFTKHIEFTCVLFHKVHHKFYQSWIALLALQRVVFKAWHLQHDVQNLQARTVLNRVCMIHEQSAYLFGKYVNSLTQAFCI